MMDSISWKQFLEWRYFASVEPFDETRMDRRFSELQHLLINRWRDTKKYPTAIPIENTMMMFGDMQRPAPPAMSWQHMRMLAQQTAAMYNAEIERDQARLAAIKTKRAA